jgi:hypothetical protein
LNNPWEDGHLIERFLWRARVSEGNVWFDMELRTAKYYEGSCIDEDELDDKSDWESPLVWGNYHACTISSFQWHKGGFKVCKLSEYSPNYLDGLELSVDENPKDLFDEDAMSFLAYILGHDSVANHKIKFERIKGTEQFNISWTGKIALTYAGDDELKYEFSAILNGMGFPFIDTKNDKSMREE